MPINVYFIKEICNMPTKISKLFEFRREYNLNKGDFQVKNSRE